MLSTSSNPDITRFSLLLLQLLLLKCSTAVAETFLEGNGINAIIRVAKSGLAGSIFNSELFETLCAVIAYDVCGFLNVASGYPL